MSDKKKPRYTNHLIDEKSPYLQQHAHNPVDWFPWGDEAFRKSVEEDKPIFLSIGYATCHWCHVMERETFEDEEIAREMNELFVNIKVDREELPQVDALYMELAQSMMAGSAGWPLNLVLTPDRKPIFAATYLPPTSQYDLLGMSELIQRIRETWSSDERSKIDMQAAALVQMFEENKSAAGTELPDSTVIENACELIFKLADPTYGGLRGSPKFPIGYHHGFLMNYSSKTQDSRAVYLSEKTLRMMYQGGLFDHLGGGFSRYTVDEQWLIPHFEKMLYDNALLSEAYTLAWQLSEIPFYQDVARETFTYIEREMTASEGGFYSAEDSETHGEEGLFYTWLFHDVMQILGEDAQIFCEYFNITPEGNFHGRNILSIPEDLETFATRTEFKPEELKPKIQQLKNTLWKVRDTGEHPFKDTKIVTSWNGLMIHSLALAGKILNQTEYLDIAERAALFVKGQLWDGEELKRRWIDSEARHPGTLEDYAFMIRACITLFEADRGVDWLVFALYLTDILTSFFKAEHGAFYQTSYTDTSVTIRNIQFSDGSEPSGNAIHTENLLRLYELTVDNRYLKEAEDILKAVAPLLGAYPIGYMYHIMNLQRYYDTHPISIVVALNRKEEYRQEIFELIHKTFIPHSTMIWRRESEDRLFDLIPFVKTQGPVDEKTTMYICHKGVCQEPLTDFEKMKASIENL